jgi:hypothetical protein
LVVEDFLAAVAVAATEGDLEGRKRIGMYLQVPTATEVTQ